MIQGVLGRYHWHEDVYKPWAGARLLLITNSIFNTFAASIKYDDALGALVVTYPVGFDMDKELIRSTVAMQAYRMEGLLAEHIANRMEA
jgi:hypothetical protein